MIYLLYHTSTLKTVEVRAGAKILTGDKRKESRFPRIRRPRFG
jgi:hypothetical protein